jgi:putative radical SAM enzyme (TIGR03279 family)
MLRNPHAGRGLKLMQRFAEGGIQMNCQIVCCPGLNDGEELMRTMRDLSGMYPQVKSVSVVPVGLTKFREGLYPLTPFTPELAEKTIDEVTGFGDECIRKYGSRIFFCGDELYLKCGRPIPPDEFYEDYVQLENGVGMLRLMETEFTSALSLAEKPEEEQRFSIATGVAATPFFEKLICKAQEMYGTIKGKVYPIENHFFGTSIDVAGLITGKDLIGQLKGKDLGERLLISHNMIRREERDFLDDITLKQASEELGVPIYPIEQDGFDLWDAMSGEALPDLPEGRQKNREEAFYRYN